MTVTVYTKPNCQPCRATKRWLDSRNIPYVERDITVPAHLEEAKTFGHLEAPIVVVDADTHWSGFNPFKLAAHCEPEHAAA